MLALRWRAKLRWVCVYGVGRGVGAQSGTDPHLSTLLDRPPLRPIGQMGMGNLSKATLLRSFCRLGSSVISQEWHPRDAISFCVR